FLARTNGLFCRGPRPDRRGFAMAGVLNRKNKEDKMTKTTTFTLHRNDSGDRRGKVDVYQNEQRIGPREQFQFRKLGDGSIAIYHNDTLLGDIDKRSQDLVDWPMESDGDDDNAQESPTDIRTRQHAAKIREQHLTEAF